MTFEDGTPGAVQMYDLATNGGVFKHKTLQGIAGFHGRYYAIEPAGPVPCTAGFLKLTVADRAVYRSLSGSARFQVNNPLRCVCFGTAVGSGRNDFGPAEMEALRIIHAVLAQEPEAVLVFHEFNNGLFPERVGNIVHGAHHGLVGWTGRQITHEPAINFHIVNRQLAQIGKRFHDRTRFAGAAFACRLPGCRG